MELTADKGHSKLPSVANDHPPFSSFSMEGGIKDHCESHAEFLRNKFLTSPVMEIPGDKLPSQRLKLHPCGEAENQDY